MQRLQRGAARGTYLCAESRVGVLRRSPQPHHAIRQYFIDRWLVYGYSYGTTRAASTFIKPLIPIAAPKEQAGPGNMDPRVCGLLYV